MRRRLAALLGTLILLPALGAAIAPAHAQAMTLAVDSSLAPAVAEIARLYEAGHPGVQLVLESAPAGVLLEHIGRGLKAGLLISADLDTLARGGSRRLLEAVPPRVVATNAIVVIESATRRVPLRELGDLAAPSVLRIAMGRLSSVPAGRDARQAIDARRLWPALQRKILVTDDVAEVLAAVARGDADAGFVYRTDAIAVPGVREAFAPDSPTPVQHAAALVAGGTQDTLARDFLAALGAEPARAVFQRRGFGLPP